MYPFHLLFSFTVVKFTWNILTSFTALLTGGERIHNDIQLLVPFYFKTCFEGWP